MADVIPLSPQAGTSTELYDVITTFLATVEFAASTVAVYEATFEKFIDDVAGDTPITKVTRTELRRHLDAMPLQIGHTTILRYGDQ